MFFSTPNRCWIARLRSGGICCHFGRISLRMCWRCSGVSLFHTCARSCNSCRCAGGRFCSRRWFSRTFCLSCGLKLLNSFFGGGVYADRGRSEEHTSELQSRLHLVCRLLLEKKKKIT